MIDQYTKQLRTNITLTVLCIAMLLALPAAASDKLPSHLASYAAQLYRENRDQLKNPAENVQKELTERAYQSMKRLSINHWSRRPHKETGLIDRYAELLKLDHANDNDHSAILKLHMDHQTLGADQALQNYYRGSGREQPKDSALKEITSDLQALSKEFAGKQPDQYKLTLDDDRILNFNLDRKQGYFKLTLTDPGSDGKKPFEFSLNGKVETKLDDSGKSLVSSAVRDDEKPIEALDEQALQARAASVAGDWYDMSGNVWIIEAEGTQITLVKMRNNDPADIATFNNVQLVGNRITGSRIHDDARDLLAGLPNQIKTNVLGRARTWLELTIDTDTSVKEPSINGVQWNQSVTYNPSTFEVYDIHKPYSKPKTMKRSAFEMGM